MERKVTHPGISKVCILGSGNVAHHIGIALFTKGINIVQIVSRNIQTGSALAKKLDCDYTPSLENMSIQADCYLLFLPNQGIEEVLSNWPSEISTKAIIAHSSGSFKMEDLSKVSSNYGVFYPLQSIKKDIEIEIEKTPFLLDASNEDTYTSLAELASTISHNSYHITDEQRKKLHLAAVFINNFSNAIYSAAYSYLDKENITLDPLQAIIEKTCKALVESHPDTLQTGPAFRGELALLHEHMDMLAPYPDHSAMYQSISNYIQNHFKVHEDS